MTSEAKRGPAMSKSEMKATVELRYDQSRLLIYGILDAIFLAGSLTALIVGFSDEKLQAIGWGGLAMTLWVSILLLPFLGFYGYRYFHYLHQAQDYIPVSATFTTQGTFGWRYGSYFSAHFEWEGKPIAVDTHSIFYAYGWDLFDLPRVAEYANRENRIAYNPKDGTIVVVGLL
jgi:hypothetical protein